MMTSRDWAWGVVPSGFKRVIDGHAGLMIVREDVETFITIGECTKSIDSYDHEASLFQGRGRLRALDLRNGDAALIRPYRHGGLLRYLLQGVFFTWPPLSFSETATT